MASIQRFETVSGTKILDSFADHISGSIRELSDEQLAATIRTAKRANSRNCPFERFFAAQSILLFALEEKRDRAFRNAA